MATSALSRIRKQSQSPAYRDAIAVAQALTPEAPIFCFSRNQLVARAKEFVSGFPGTVTYAVKSNPSSEVLQTLAEAGLKIWDAASVQEMALVRAVSPEARFNYHNPVKSRREIADAYSIHGCRRFAVDCKEELRKVAEAAGAAAGIEIAVRFVLPRERTSSAHDFSTKFGAPEHICVALLRDAAAMGFTPLLTFHPGSQSLDPQTYVRHIQAAARIAGTAGMRISKLNVGGGFPANYLLSKAGPASTFFKSIGEAATRAFGAGKEPQLECEPGRGLVADCMSLLTRMKLVCSDGDDIFINDGVYGGLMEYMQVPELKPPYRVIRDGKVVGGETKPWKVFGPTCDPLDVLPHRLDLPVRLLEGDYMEFGTLGAYGLATSTTFNGYGGHRIAAVERTLTCDGG
jgi:ornithine decarboxylase